jgi:mono/diheme cytochrome c family protein
VLQVLCLTATLGGGVVAANDTPVRFPDGAATFQANCAVCHRANGAGTPGLAPPVKTYAPKFIATPDGRSQLAMTVLYGMYGEIVVDERHYNFKMPEFSRFDDATIAAVLNYVAFDLGGAAPDTPALAASDIAAQRVHAVDGDAVRQHRAQAIGSLTP